MKANEAIHKLNRVSLDKKADAILDLYLKEFMDRKQLRFGDRQCLASSFESLNKEMANWISKVMIGAGLTEEYAKDFANKLSSATTKISQRHIISTSFNHK